MKIVGIGGSLRNDSHAYKALKIALQQVQRAGWNVEMVDLRNLKLPFCDGSKEYPHYPDVALLRQAVQSAQGIVLATPEYHGSVSGVLKNALDLIDVELVEGKVFGIITVLGGAFSHGASNVIRQICRQLRAWTLPGEMVIPYAQNAFNAQGELTDPEMQKRMQALINQLMDSTRKLVGFNKG